MTDTWQIRELQSDSDYQQCVDLQRAIWGEHFTEVVPAAILKVSQQVGGVAGGAFNGAGELVGFVFGITGIEQRADGYVPVHWSDMLAVRPELRNQGLGERLKRYQRDVLLGRQVQTIYWTFDPLDAKNAHINFTRLGIFAHEYRVNMYGAQTDSPLHRGIGTDRLIAVWPIGTARVQERLAGNRGTTPAAAATIEIPLNIHEINASQPEVARAWRERTRAEFTRYLEQGYVVVDFLRHDNGGHYVLGAAPGLDK